MGDKLPRGLYALLDDSLVPPGELPAFAAKVAKVAAVAQVRLKSLRDRDALALIRQVKAALDARNVPLIVNDRADLALICKAAGVHLGDDDLPVAEARKILGPQALIGRTCRNLAHIAAAKEQGADHAGVGPVFVTTTKSVEAPRLGLEGLREVCSASPLPVVAIAGIGPSTFDAVLSAGAHCAAVGSLLPGFLK
jgi:thiamine-phosphate pyrophosphorylase